MTKCEDCGGKIDYGDPVEYGEPPRIARACEKCRRLHFMGHGECKAIKSDSGKKVYYLEDGRIVEENKK
ncbi:hypothetical protein ACFLZC_01315 [Patescibacteria group bacterium]